MTLFQEIYTWSTGLKPCLRDALRRLRQNITLSSSDFDDLFALLKLEVGIPDSKNRVPEPLDLTHLPSLTTSNNTVRLVSLHSLQNVNRIANQQTLEFVPLGLTVIYGNNGSGKSGYSRVLKIACRARDDKATVLPNAHLPKHEQGVPQAKFVIEIGGKNHEVDWKLGSAPHAEMSKLSVFDATCARSYVDSENNVAYLPYGLDIIENLAQVVFPELSKRLTLDLQGCTVDLNAFQDLKDTTAVGKMISGLSWKTDKALVEKLATFEEKDIQRHTILVETLKEGDPKAKAAAIRRTIGRVKELHDRVNSFATLFGVTAIETAKSVDDATQAAINAETLAVNQFKAGESILPGTGGAEWQSLFDSARRFAAVAYEDKAFPVSEDRRCLLCQQEMNDGLDRMKRFDEFIKNDATKVANLKRSEHTQVLEKYANAVISLGIDSSLQFELDQSKPGLSATLETFALMLEERRKRILEAFTSHDWDSKPEIGEDPRPVLTALLQQLADSATALDQAANEEVRLKLQTEFAELDARRRLTPRKEHVLAAIDKLVLKAKLDSCNELLKPRPVSDKSKELTHKAVTVSLRDTLNREFEALGVHTLKAKLADRVASGKTLHKLILDVPNSHKPAEVLSEGELRVMAIASFLAELAISGHTGAAIFDDPVSSLDHLRRAKVAKRLVEEAKKRQVIVFTHDTVFLSDLRNCIADDVPPSKFCHLQWTVGGFAGHCVDGLPWDHQSHKERINDLEQQQRALAKAWIANPTDQLSRQMRDTYGEFRATIERVVEHVVLCGTMRRFSRYIEVKSVKGIVGLTKAEFDEIYRLFKNACDVTDAHDPASDSNTPVPDPAALLKDLDDLKKVIEVVNARRKIAEKA